MVPLVLALTVTLPPVSSLEIQDLVRQLGSRSFQEREVAQKRLEALGERALPALKEAAETSADLEVRRRAERLILVVAPPVLDREEKKLRGTWRQVRTVRAGRLLEGLPCTWYFGDQHFRSLAYRDGEVFGKNSGSYRVTDLGALDIQIRNHDITRWLYRLEGDTLFLCSHDNGKRPKTFDTLKDAGLVLVTLQRQPPHK